VHASAAEPTQQRLTAPSFSFFLSRDDLYAGLVLSSPSSSSSSSHLPMTSIAGNEAGSEAAGLTSGGLLSLDCLGGMIQVSIL
jgi:hypothetical protein